MVWNALDEARDRYRSVMTKTLGWDERGYEWTDTQGSRWKCIDAQWCWYSPKSKCWHRGDRQLIEMSGPYAREVANPIGVYLEET